MSTASSRISYPDCPCSPSNMLYGWPNTYGFSGSGRESVKSDQWAAKIRILRLSVQCRHPNDAIQNHESSVRYCMMTMRGRDHPIDL